MLVAVLVGAIRNQAEYNFDPAAMLATLNRRLMGRSGAFCKLAGGGDSSGRMNADRECGASPALSQWERN
jgi:hypothetical protein